MALQIKNYKKSKSEGVVEAYIDFYIPDWGLYLNQCKLIKSENGSKFIGFPCKSYEYEGETKYAPYFVFDKDKNSKFQKAAHDCIKDYLAKENSEDAPF